MYYHFIDKFFFRFELTGEETGVQRLLRQDLVGRVELAGHDVGVHARGELHQQVVEHAHRLDRRGFIVLTSLKFHNYLLLLINYKEESKLKLLS